MKAFNPALVCVVAACLGLSCASAPPVRQRVSVEASARGRGPLPGVRILLRGKVLAETRADGRAELELPDEGGAQVSLEVRCPPDFRSPAGPVVPRKATIRSLDGGGGGVVTTLTCQPLVQDVALVVSTHGVAGCPIFVDGAARGSTDGKGLAHLLLQVAPESLVDVELRGPGGSPWRGGRSFRVHDEDDVLVVSEDVPQPRRARARVSRVRTIVRVQ